MKNILHSSALWLMLIVYFSGSASAQEVCLDATGNQAQCVGKYIRDIGTNSDSTQIGSSSFRPERTLNYNNISVKSSVEGNVANQPIYYKGCDLPSNLTWSVGVNQCEANSFNYSNMRDALLRTAASKFPHGYYYNIYDISSSNTTSNNESKGQVVITCDNGNWVKSQAICKYGHCDAFAEINAWPGEPYSCRVDRVKLPDDTVPYYQLLQHGESSWYNNHRIGVPNGDGRVILTCDRGTLVNNTQQPSCTKRECVATKIGWHITTSADSNPNYGNPEYVMMEVLSYGNYYNIPPTYAPSGTKYYKCITDVPALAPDQRIRVYDKTNPTNYVDVSCTQGLVVTKGSSLCN